MRPTNLYEFRKEGAAWQRRELDKETSRPIGPWLTYQAVRVTRFVKKGGGKMRNGDIRPAHKYPVHETKWEFK